jgi:transposase InsO family protein
MSQPDEKGYYHPTAFWSKKFSGPELNYSTPDKELFAIVWSFKHWRHYLEGSLHRVIVLSDHANLQSFMKQSKMNGRQARWCLYLTPFDFIIKHRSGKSNPADGPSRKWNQSHRQVPSEDVSAPIRERIAGVQALHVKDLLVHKSEFELGERPLQKHHSELSVLELGERPLQKHHSELCVSERGERPLQKHHSELIQSKRGERPLQRDSELDTRIALSLEETGIEAADWAVWEDLSSDQAVPQCVVQQVCLNEDIYEDEANIDLKSLIHRLQNDDPETTRRKAAVQQGAKGFKNWHVDANGLLRFKNRLYVPASAKLRQKIISLYHDDRLAGHFGRSRTEELLKRKFHWINLQDDVAEYVQECQICQGAAVPKHRPYGKLETLPIPSRPFEELSMDFITGLPAVEYKGQLVDAILVVVDRFTKWSIFLPVPSTINAAELAELFHTEVELRYGPPKGIVSDRGSLFTSKFWSELSYQSHIKLRLSTAYHPQTDGQTERMNQTLEHYLRCFVDHEQLTWPKLLPTAQYACNNAINATTGVSPYEALHGQTADFHIRIEDDTTREEVPAAKDRIQKLQAVRERLKEHWRNTVESQAKYYNKTHKPQSFKRKDLVRLSTKNLKLKVPNRKLAPKFIGPFRVLGTVGSQAYRLSLPNQYDRIHNVFHVSLLEPWYGKPNDDLPMPELADDEEWEVEEIKAKDTREGESYYLVKWKGWPSEYNQWVSEDDMANAPRLVRAFNRENARSTKR